MSTYSELRHNFAPYREEVRGIRQDLRTARDVHSVIGYIDSGSCAHVVQLPSDGSLLAKIPHRESYEDPHRFAVKTRADAMVRGLGKAGLEQIVAYSTRRRLPAVITRFVEGHTWGEDFYIPRQGIPADHYIGLLAVFSTMQQSGLITEGRRYALHHPHNGFTVIDYERGDGQSLTDKVIDFAYSEPLYDEISTEVIVNAQGLLYRDVCADILGKDMGATVTAYWRGLDFVVPE